MKIFVSIIINRKKHCYQVTVGHDTVIVKRSWFRVKLLSGQSDVTAQFYYRCGPLPTPLVVMITKLSLVGIPSINSISL